MAFLTNQFWYCKSGGWTAVAAWPGTSQAVSAGTLCRQLTTPTVGNERVFACVIAGTTNGTAEPTWNITQGSTTTDGTVTWIEITGKAGVNGDLTNCTNWTMAKSLALSQGVIIQDNAGTTLQIVTTAGTTGSGSEPSFSSTAGVTTSDNSVTWTSLGLASGLGAYAAPWARLNLALDSGAFVNSGDICYVSNNHAETSSVTLNYNNNFGAPYYISIFCVNDGAVPPTASASTASVTATGSATINLQASVTTTYIQGVKFISANGIGTGGINTRYDTCVFQISGGGISLAGSSGASYSNGNTSWDQNCLQLYNCSLIFSTSTQGLGPAIFTMIGGSITSTGSMPATLFDTTSGSFTSMINVLMRDVNLSTFTGTIMNSSGATGGQVLLENCSLGSGVTLYTGTPHSPHSVQYIAPTPVAKIHNCGTSSSAYPVMTENILGSLTQLVSAYRTGGASSFSVPFGWILVTSANSTFVNPFISEDISVINSFTSGSHTLTLYLTTAATLTNAQLWTEMEYPASSGSTLSSLVRSKASLISLGATLTTDSGSTWTGGLTNKYKIVLTYSPVMVSIMKARIYLATPSTTVIFDPLPVLA